MNIKFAVFRIYNNLTSNAYNAKFWNFLNVQNTSNTPISY